MSMRNALRYLWDWKGTIITAVIGGLMVIYGLPALYQYFTKSPTPLFYYYIAIPLFMSGVFLLPIVGLLWHVYKETTDPLIMAVRYKVMQEFMDDKKYGGLMDKLVKAELTRTIDYYFPPIKEGARDRVKRVVGRVVRYVHDYVQ